jgi:1-acyl-sn-glycerol-3-phosphate acyltransferase
VRVGGVLPEREAADTFINRWLGKALREGVLTSFALGFTLPYFRLFNEVRVQGDEIIDSLPRRGVVFLSNHQTYFLEAIAFFDLVYVRHQLPLDDPVMRFSAAEETMKMNPLTWLMKAAGGVTVKRRYRDAGREVNRPPDLEGIGKIVDAMNGGWLLHFPTGTTKLGAPVRPGVPRLLHDARPIVVPVRVAGFRRLLFFRQLPGRLFRRCSIRLMEPMDLAEFYEAPYTDEAGEIVRRRIEDEIYGRSTAAAAGPQASPGAPPPPPAGSAQR